MIKLSRVTLLSKCSEFFLCLDYMRKLRCNKAFGAAAIDAYGSPAIVIRAKSFPWAYCKGSTIFYGSAIGEFFCERVHVPKDEDDVATLDCFCDDEPEKKFPQCD